MSIEQRFDVSLIAAMALREKQIQQNYRPIIGVHKWFARRPGTLFRGLILAEFGDAPLEEAFFRANDLPGIRIADPFMGGGTPLIEANRVGCDVQGFDVNPMSAWIVREEVRDIDLPRYRETAETLIDTLRQEIGRYYRTSCPRYGDRDVPVKSFLWVKVLDCRDCGRQVDLFPGYLLAQNRRHARNVFICPECHDLNEVDGRKNAGNCATCGTALREPGPAGKGRCECPHCGYLNTYPADVRRPLSHRMFAIEYYNPERKAEHRGRFFKKPDAEDFARIEAAEKRCQALAPRFVPDEEIASGDETARLHRWGYLRYKDLFNPRQLVGLELSCRFIASVENTRIRHALATNLSDLLRYQNMLCRYDAAALKSLDVFSVHGFPVSLIQCESNLLGIVNGNGSNVGSGGWSNVVDKYVKAKSYCATPFEVRRSGARNVRVPTPDERIGEQGNGRRRVLTIRCQSAMKVELAPRSLDAVFTDPPYFGNVQYGELMDFCYVWLRRLVGTDTQGFHRPSTRSPEELTGNVTQGRDLVFFTEGLSEAYRCMARALKAGAPLAFTYHHNKVEAYCAVAIAVLDSGLVCSASLPCPAEMGGSIHIHGTSSSIIDTIFVCRSSGRTPRRWLFDSADHLAAIVAEDLDHLRVAGGPLTHGDVRCVVHGHLTRMAIWKLRRSWDAARSTPRKLSAVAETMAAFGDADQIIESVTTRRPKPQSSSPLFSVPPAKEERCDAISF